MSPKSTSSPPVDEVMTVAEIAQYLKVSERTIQRMIQAKEVPTARVSGQWRFVKAVIDDWILSKMQRIPKSHLVQVAEPKASSRDLSDLLPEAHILLDLYPGPRHSILRQLVGALLSSGSIPSAEPLISHLEKREEMMSTAVGEGIALPHPRDPETLGYTQDLVVLGICPLGVDFGAPGKEKTFVFGLVVARDTTSHLRLMAKLTYFFRAQNTIDRLRAATSPLEVRGLLKESGLSLQNNHQRGAS